jgi:hypothetical protein
MNLQIRRSLRLVGAALLLCALAAAQAQTWNLDRLMSFLHSSLAMKPPPTDSQIASELSKCKLSERLEDAELEKLRADGVGSKTLTALKALRDQSKNLPVAKPATSEVVELPPAPNAQQYAEIIEEVREDALNYTRSLPNFLSTQVVKRYRAAVPGTRYAQPGATEPSWVPLDNIELLLSFFEQHEEYKLSLIGDRTTTKEYKNVGGATSAGEFGSLLRGIFERGTHAQFEWERWATLRGKLVMAFNYRVEQQFSQWGIEYEKKDHVVPGYSGDIFLDKDTHVVLRVTLHADNLPESFPIKMAATILDYDYIDLKGQIALLPAKSEMQMSADGVLTKNETEFRNYRKYTAEAKIDYFQEGDKAPKVDCKDPKNAVDAACKK